MDPFIVVDGVSKGFLQGGQERLVLDKVCFSVQEGEFVAIVGQSGAGKTTLLRLLSGLESTTEGRIKVANEQLESLTESQRDAFRQHKVGFAFQLFDLMDRITIIDNVALPLILNGMARPKALTEALEMLKRLGLTYLANALPQDVSGGEMQRVALARALVKKPKLLLADEPTGSLDSLEAEKVLELLKDVRKNHQLTILMVTHNTRAAAHADRVLRLKQGRIKDDLKGILYA